jgi:hypothetical protein
MLLNGTQPIFFGWRLKKTITGVIIITITATTTVTSATTTELTINNNVECQEKIKPAAVAFSVRPIGAPLRQLHELSHFAALQC